LNCHEEYVGNTSSDLPVWSNQTWTELGATRSGTASLVAAIPGTLRPGTVKPETTRLETVHSTTMGKNLWSPVCSFNKIILSVIWRSP
jgi:hypothetical protein